MTATPTLTALEAAIHAELRKRLTQPDNPALTAEETIERARSGVRKVDLMGERGITLVTTQEVEAMALMLVVLGLEPYAQAKGVTETTKGDTP